MSKTTVSVTFHTRAPFTLTRDVRLNDGTLVKGVKVVVERVTRKGKALSLTREYSIEEFHYDIPGFIQSPDGPRHETLEQEQVDELINVLDNFVLRVEWWLAGGDKDDGPHTCNHIITRTHKRIRDDQQISL